MVSCKRDADNYTDREMLIKSFTRLLISDNTEELAAVLLPKEPGQVVEQVGELVADQVPDTDMLHLADAYYEDGNFPKGN